MIKIKLRRSLIYLYVYYISSSIEKISIGTTFHSFFNFYPFLEFFYLMSFGNIFGGLLIYLYQNNSLKKKEKFKFFGINLIHTKKKLVMMENLKKQY